MQMKIIIMKSTQTWRWLNRDGTKLKDRWRKTSRQESHYNINPIQGGTAVRAHSEAHQNILQDSKGGVLSQSNG